MAVAMSMGIFAAVCAFLKASTLPSVQTPDFTCTSDITLLSPAVDAVLTFPGQIPAVPSLCGARPSRPSLSWRHHYP